MNASALDRRIRFRRRILVDDGFGMVEQWRGFGPPVAAARQDVSDREKFAAGWIEATLDARFIVRASAFTRDLTPLDRLTCEGRDYDILGIKQAGDRHAWFEITCRTRVDATGRARED